MKGFSCLQMTRVLMMHCGPQQDLAEVHTRLVAQTGGCSDPSHWGMCINTPEWQRTSHKTNSRTSEAVAPCCTSTPVPIPHAKPHRKQQSVAVRDARCFTETPALSRN